MTSKTEPKIVSPGPKATIEKELLAKNISILDVGCGGGFISNGLAKLGLDVVGLDASEESLSIARKNDSTGTVDYLRGDANQLCISDQQFDVVLAMDFLEHVERPDQIIGEISRVLKPGGLFFFHTFNRNPLSHLINIKLVEWMVNNTPKNLHVPELFIKPVELRNYCSSVQLDVEDMRGLKPVIWGQAMLHALLTGQINDDFRFEFTDSLLLSYSGYARKGSRQREEK